MEHIIAVGGENAVEDISLSSICRGIKPRRVKVAMKVVNQKRKSKLVSCSCRRLEYSNNQPTSQQPSAAGSSNDQEGNLKNIPSNYSIQWHGISASLDTILVGVMQVKFQNKSESPFETHPVQMQTFLFAICIYCALLGIKTHKHNHTQILSCAHLLLGALSWASLLSILLNQKLLCVVLITWGSIPIILAPQLLLTSFYRMIDLVAKLIRDVPNYCNWRQ